MAYADGLSIKVELTEFTAQEIRQLGIIADQRIVQASPVDTGLFKNNWLMSIGSPTLETVEEEDKSGSKAINRAKEVVLSYPLDSLPDLWLVNNLPYAARLNDGWSEQAPSKFVEAELAQAVAYGR